MGLGLLGRGVNVAKFLAECGAELTITDLKTKKEMAPSLKKLSKFKNIKYVLGEHRLSDFDDEDMIIKAAGVPLDSPYIKEALKNKIPVEMDASLFAKLSGAKIIGVTGTRGKSTVTQLIYEILKHSGSPRSLGEAGKRVFLGGNVKGLATLPLLKKMKDGDIVVMELDSWQLQGFGDAQISPNIAVFTTFLRDHQNYYKNDMEKYFSDKANIFKFQKENDTLVVGENFFHNIKSCAKNAGAEIAQDFKNGATDTISSANTANKNNANKIKSNLIVANKKNIPRGWKIKLAGEHNLENVALAVDVARKFGVKELVIKKAVENFKGLPGRLEFVKEIKGVKYYNDTTATTPEAVIVALKSLPPDGRTSKENKGKIILIGGGADKNLEYGEYAKVVKKYIKVLILFKGAASDKIVHAVGKVKFPLIIVDNMKDAVKLAKNNANKGDIILLSPGAASFGVFKNEFDRGEQFNVLVKKNK